MADDNENPLTKGIRNKEHLTWTDMIRAQTYPINEKAVDGSVTTPKKDFLQRQADDRKAKFDEEQRRRKAKGE